MLVTHLLSYVPLQGFDTVLSDMLQFTSGFNDVELSLDLANTAMNVATGHYFDLYGEQYIQQMGFQHSGFLRPGGNLVMKVYEVSFAGCVSAADGSAGTKTQRLCWTLHVYTDVVVGLPLMPREKGLWCSSEALPHLCMFNSLGQLMPLLKFMWLLCIVTVQRHRLQQQRTQLHVCISMCYSLFTRLTTVCVVVCAAGCWHTGVHQTNAAVLYQGCQVTSRSITIDV